MNASGWPRENMTHEEKLEYIINTKQESGIELSFEELEKGKNPGLITIAKLMLNSLWGAYVYNYPLLTICFIQVN